MNYLDVPAGDHAAKAVKATPTIKNGKPQIEVDFHLTDLDATMRWYGYFTAGAMPITLKALDLLDWNGDETFAAGAINTDKEVSVKVGMNTWNGVTKPKIEFVNAAGATGFGTGDGTEFKGLNLKAEMAKFRQGKSGGASSTKSAGEPSFDTEEKLPF